MCTFGGYPLLIATVAVAALLSGCGQASRPASSQRPPTMDVSIVVTVEIFDPEESPEVEEAPVMAEAPGGGQVPADMEIPAAEEIPFMAEAPAGVEPEADAEVPLGDEKAAVASIPPDGATPANKVVPPDAEAPAMAEVPAGAEPMANDDVPPADGTTPAAETRVTATMRAAVTIPDFGERSRVFFVFDSAAIQGDQQAMIDEWGLWLKAHPDWALRIEGHTDRQGSCLYNRWLGQQRANAARDILVKQGIDASRLLVVSFGEDRPTIPGASRAERSRNRRVRAEPMRLADLENYDPDLPPCASTIMARSEPSEAATAETALAAGTGDSSRPEPAEKPVLEKISRAN